MDGFAPVIVIEGFLGLGVVLLLYWLHMREMKQIRAEKARRAAQEPASDNPASPTAPNATTPRGSFDTPSGDPR
jgi:hypothetical protein